MWQGPINQARQLLIVGSALINYDIELNGQLFEGRTTTHPWYNSHKYKCLWGGGDKSRSSNLQEGVSHTYTLRLSYSIILSY